jgi:hypothetical protein
MMGFNLSKGMTAWITTREETNSEFMEGFHSSCFSFFLFGEFGSFFL